MPLLFSRRSALVVAMTVAYWLPACAKAATFVRFDTTKGIIDFQLFDDEMPRSTDNFLSYVTSERYDGSFVHLSTPVGASIVVIQGGGFYFSNAEGLADVPNDPPILDEPGGGVAGPSNLRGTIAFAKRGVDTVESQWFINVADNVSLDDPEGDAGGFSAFGAVLNDGMTVVDEIASLPRIDITGGDPTSPFGFVPLMNFAGGFVGEEHLIYIHQASEFEPRPGDFNLDGSVDDEDFAVLEANLGTAAGAFFDQGDSDMDGDVDGHDVLAWQRDFGGPLAGGSFAAAVPEPISGTLFVLATLALLSARGRGAVLVTAVGTAADGWR